MNDAMTRRAFSGVRRVFLRLLGGEGIGKGVFHKLARPHFLTVLECSGVGSQSLPQRIPRRIWKSAEPSRIDSVTNPGSPALH